MNNVRAQLNLIAQKQVDDLAEKYIENLKKQVVKIIKKRVPIDTEELKDEGISAISYKEGKTYVIDVFVNDLPHSGSRLTMKALGLILNVKDLRRSRSQASNPAGSTTAGWWLEAVEDIKVLLKAS